MRMIKFRGKDIYNDQWIYGLVQHIAPKNDWGIEYIVDDNGNYGVVEIDIKTLGQFTGLSDKDGKDIYEGDILGKESFVPWAVVWDEWGACFAVYNVNDPNKTLWGFNANGSFTHTIIGNIYENPELLEVE